MTKASSSVLGRFLKHSSIYAVGNMLNRIGALILLPIYTNYLSVAQYGALEFFYVISAVVTGLLSAGIANATLRFYFDFANETDRSAVVTTNLAISLVLSVLGSIAISFWSSEIASAVFGVEHGFRYGVQIVLATLVMELSSQVCLAYVRAKEHSLLFVAVMLFKLLAQVAANTYFVIHMHWGVEGILLGNMLAVALGWALLVTFVIRHCGLQFHSEKILPTLTYSFPFLLSTLIGIVSAYSDRFLINSVLSLQALGIFALAMKFSDILENLIGEPFNRSYGSFRLSVMSDPNAAKIQANIVRLLVIGLAVAGLGVIYFCYDLLRLMSDSTYWSAAAVVPVLVLGSALNILVYPAQTGIYYQKRTRHIFHLAVLGAIASVIANVVFINLWGLLGAAIAYVLKAIVILGAANHISNRYFPVRYDLRRIMGTLAIVFAFFVLGFPFLMMPSWLAVFAKALLFLAFVAALYFSGILSDTERARVRNLLTRRAA